ncbi:GNAT family N-acetyltransferase [Naumannella halotolerans]|uniref:Acyl-CoA synthetase (NDP forming) n=1 Tax=Naumannella halotolerans TaxID=993414 RepID=A0A4R7J9P0_9ACTN|nr:GNAT family N-acetyltransferase [Naumannella halotolerans]TDT33223.1 acyl-CoA synthetase (NDP forming) [Naumannella halotolerans]
MTSERPEASAEYPEDWEADVLLSDGAVAHLRPITPDDAELLVDFYARVSPESKYLRFFAPYPVLSEADVHRFTHVDHVDRVALIITVSEPDRSQRMLAVGRFDRVGPDEAEVAFLVEDSQQGRGIGQLLLEHLAHAARQRGIGRFVAEVLPQNRRMAQVFIDAGYQVHRQFDDGVIMVEFPILATDTAVGVMERREQRAESASVRRLVQPERIALVGLSRQLGVVARQLLDGGFAGELILVGEIDLDSHAGDPRLVRIPSLADLQGGVDLVVVCTEAHHVRSVLLDAAYHRAHGVVLMTGADPDHRSRPRTHAEDLVSLARSYGLRMVGPDALGLINTPTSMNASPAPLPRPGVVGVFTQSSPVGMALLNSAARNSVGVSTFFSSGLHADVSVNDVMQMWEDDETTTVCVMSIDRIGNPRKFSRIARRLARRKPVILWAPGRSQRGNHEGARGGLSKAPEEAIDALFRQSGVITSERRDAMMAVAKILARQPLPRGERVRLLSNSQSLLGHMTRFSQRSGLIPTDPVLLPTFTTAEGYVEAAAAAEADDTCDAVLVAPVDPYGLLGMSARQALEERARVTSKPLIGVFVDFDEITEAIDRPDGQGQLPAFTGYADALYGLASGTAYARWRDRDSGAVPLFDHDVPAARRVIRAVLAEAPDGRTCTPEETTTILRAYGINPVPSYPVGTLDDAVARAEQLGWNAVLKATSPLVRGQRDLASVHRNIDDPDEMQQAWQELAELTAQLQPAEVAEGDWVTLARPVVQAMMVPGVSLVLRSREDPAFGPIISVAVAGLAEDLLGDTSYRVSPLTTQDARAMVRDLKAAPVLFGRHGAAGVDVAKVEDLLTRLAQLGDDLPQIADCRLSPVIASRDQVAVAGAQITLAPTADERDARFRRL